MTVLDLYIQHDLDDLLRSIEHDPLDNQTEAYLWRQAGSLFRYQSEIGNVCDYIVDVQIRRNNEVQVTLLYKTCLTDESFKKVVGVVTMRPQLAAAAPPGQVGSGSHQSASSQGTVYNGGAGHGTYSINSTGTSPMSGKSIGSANNVIPNMVNSQSQARSRSAKLPPICFEEQDDTGTFIRMTLEPDWQITTTDSLKISMMLFSAATQPYSFSTHAYVKANQLERHFTFKTV